MILRATTGETLQIIDEFQDTTPPVQEIKVTLDKCDSFKFSNICTKKEKQATIRGDSS